ncbi:MAG TPA: molybdopterin cofactor-binding domain-containing protein, partial [Tepidisphaeraceae bacterium]|nr:molybdopterin cofactor-binding domain-containing protein [Tepidisphaeraceae bacterium]
MSTHRASRREFLKGTGCLLVGFNMLPADALAAQEGRRARLPGSLSGWPDVDSWLRINADGTITVLTGKMEIGQGIRTAVAQIAAEELDVAIGRVRVTIADTGVTPNEGYTAASMSIESSGMAIRSAAAEARQMLLELAGQKLNAGIDRLEVSDGTIRDRAEQGSVTYWDLLGGKRLQRKASGTAPIKRPEQHTVVGKPVERLEIPDMITGRPVYVQDMRLPGMLHGRILRPPSYSAVLQSIPEAEVAVMEGILKVVRDGSFVGVIAQREEQAVWAVERLKLQAKWKESEQMPAFRGFYAQIRKLPVKDSTVREVGKVEEAMRSAKTRVEATYIRPYHMHASIGPSCAIAQLADGQMTVWTHSQGPYPLRATLANLLGMPAEKIRAIGVPGSGCYGHNGADDVAADAALLARALPGKPIRVQWSREDEHRWEPYGSAMMFDVRGGLDENGNIVAWDYLLWSDMHGGRPGGDASAFLAARYLANPREPRRGLSVGGGSRNSEPLYDLPNQRIIARAFHGPLRVSSLRGLGAYGNIFALESFMDELAHAGKVDPVAFRLRHLRDPRGRAVIEAAAKAGQWGTQRPVGRGLGFAFARYKN